MRRHGVALLLALVLLVSGTATTLALLRTSATFDEIVMVAGGARGWATGTWDLAPEHPPLVQVLYGLPVHLLAAPALPSEVGVTPADRAFMGYRYEYARSLLWRSGNDGARLVVLGRLPAVLAALGLVLATFALARPRLGAWPALLAATVVAFLPDVLAHGGVAYNDVPGALTYLLAVFALDAAVRAPAVGRGALAGVVVGLALGVKFNALALGPVALLLALLEYRRQRSSALWRRALARAAAVGAVAAYATLVVVYLGDFTLEHFRHGAGFALGQVEEGHSAPAYLLGATSQTGWPWFYPVAFLFKTPVALHLLMAVAVAGFLRRDGEDTAPSHGVLRPALVGLAVFGAALLASRIAIGFRYVLPVLPLLAIVVAAGVARAWRRGGRPLRTAVVLLAVAHAATVLSWHPWYLSFVSLYHPERDSGHRVLVDSSLDWGQGLRALREEMDARGIDVVQLSYFGSALPEGYGVEHVPLPSFLPLPPRPAPAQEPRWAVVSATNLHDVYVRSPVLDRLRALRPETVVAHTLFLYRLP